MAHINQDTLDLVKRFEGLRLTAYRCPAGVVTIGYGYTNRAGFGPGVKMGDVWSEAQADEMLDAGLSRCADQVLALLTRAPTDNQFGAMVSLAYNIGLGAFSKSTCLKRFNAGDIEGAAEALTWFNKAGGKVLRGLVRRREAEADLFLKDSSVVGAPLPVPDKERTSPLQSTTLQASVACVAAGAAKGVTAVSALDGTAQIIIAGLACIVVLGALWICRERLKRWAAGDR